MVLDKLCDSVKSVKIEEQICEADYGEIPLTLERAVDICRTIEMTEEHLKEKTEVKVNAAYSRGRSNTRRGNAGYNRGTPRGTFHSRGRGSHAYDTNCGYCGRKHPRGMNNCPAYGTTCGQCNQMNHWARCCKNVHGYGYQSSRGDRGQNRGHRGQRSRS